MKCSGCGAKAWRVVKRGRVECFHCGALFDEIQSVDGIRLIDSQGRVQHFKMDPVEHVPEKEAKNIEGRIVMGLYMSDQNPENWAEKKWSLRRCLFWWVAYLAAFCFGWWVVS